MISLATPLITVNNLDFYCSGVYNVNVCGV